MINLGDITKIDGHIAPPVNVIIGGSPCQNFSVAGNKTGLSGNAKYDFCISGGGINSTLVAKGAPAICHQTVDNQFCVRRLTPTECERLQGFPDGWTDIGIYIDSNGKRCKTSDTARYKSLGNSIAIPPWAWILERLSKHCNGNVTMASLFDGIGGFPLIWETINGTGTCLWSSEIDEFSIAVTKYQFN